MKRHILNNQRGMTLIEAVIGLAIFAMFALIVNTIFMNVLRSMTKEEALKEVKQNGERALQIMTNEIRTAQFVDESVCGGSLRFIRTDGEEIVYEGVTEGGIGRVQKRFVDGTPLPGFERLTGELADVQTLTFSCDGLTSGEVEVTIDLTLEHANIIHERGDTSAETTFHTTVVTR